MEITLLRMIPEMLKKVEEVRRQHSNEIGFLPERAMQHYCRLGSCLVALRQGEIVGFIVGTFSMASAPVWSRIYQAAVDRDYMYSGIGKMMVECWHRTATQMGTKATLVHVREDLPSVRFWKAINYEFIGFERGGTARGHRSMTWVKPHAKGILEDPTAPIPRHHPGGKNQLQGYLRELQDRAD